MGLLGPSTRGEDASEVLCAAGVGVDEVEESVLEVEEVASLPDALPLLPVPLLFFFSFLLLFGALHGGGMHLERTLV